MRKRNVPGILAKRLAGALGVCALIFGGSSCLMVQAAPAEVYDEAGLLSDDRGRAAFSSDSETVRYV